MRVRSVSTVKGGEGSDEDGSGSPRMEWNQSSRRACNIPPCFREQA